jgi:hypothetical protein
LIKRGGPNRVRLTEALTMDFIARNTSEGGRGADKARGRGEEPALDADDNARKDLEVTIEGRGKGPFKL